MAATPTDKLTRLWLDGCFDGHHFAHANAVRQARDLFKGPVHLTVGIHSDADILKNKGPTLFTEQERYQLMRGCRWVDHVAEGVPYVTQLEVIDEHDIDYVVHGDDPVLDANGFDCYSFAKAAGRYKEVKRTEGISTTSLIDRILNPKKQVRTDQTALRGWLDKFSASCSPAVPVVDFLNAPSRLKSSLPEKRAFIFGAFDCFGPGDVELLQRAKDALPAGTALAVGLWDDVTVEVLTGDPPLLGHLERALALVQCRNVDAVLLYSPLSPSPAAIKSLGVSHVVQFGPQKLHYPQVEIVIIEGPQLLTIAALRQRVQSQLDLFTDRQTRKGA